jgi:hypothetical protein
MNGYINKQDAIDVVQILQTKMSEKGSNTLESVISAITDMAEADVIPVVHGHWIFNERDHVFYCTNCKNGCIRNHYPYCHWCGAKMDVLGVTE